MEIYLIRQEEVFFKMSLSKKELFKIYFSVLKNPLLMRKLKTFEQDIKPLLCDTCIHKVDLAVKKKQNIIILAGKKKYFCDGCSDEIILYTRKIGVLK